MAISTVKNKLYAAVKNTKHEELKISAFVRAIKEKTPFSLALTAIQKAMDTNTLHYDNYQWFIKLGTGPKSGILTLSPENHKKAKIMLAFEILSKEDKYERVKSLYGEEAPLSPGTAEKIDVLPCTSFAREASVNHPGTTSYIFRYTRMVRPVRPDVP